jgi:hypothetical protein
MGAYMPLPRRAKGHLQDLIVFSCEGEGEQGSGRKEKGKAFVVVRACLRWGEVESS